MRIVFNCLNSGLGNNGGSRTILLSAETLRTLGHECEVASNIDLFTWFKHRETLKYLPNNFDVVINVAAVDYPLTQGCSIEKKFAWWRGHEDWANSEKYLKACYTDTTVINITNSKGLQALLSTYNAKSYVIYQGIDLSFWEDLELRADNRIRIGSLYNKKPTKRFNDFIKLTNLLDPDKYEFISFGTQPLDCNNINLKIYAERPTKTYLRNLYSSCHIWFAPTESEGLHNPPMEASLCGAVLLCNDNINNGMVLDYASTQNSLIYSARNIEQAAVMLQQYKKVDAKILQNYIRNKIGDREYNMKKLVNLIEAL